jgi:hypothetical protein
LLAWLLQYDSVLIAVSGIVFAAIGYAVRRRAASGVPNHGMESESLVFQDGFAGASIATLVLVGVIGMSLESPEAVIVLKRQQSTIILFSFLGTANLALQFKRSLRWVSR